MSSTLISRKGNTLVIKLCNVLAYFLEVNKEKSELREKIYLIKKYNLDLEWIMIVTLKY